MGVCCSALYREAHVHTVNVHIAEADFAERMSAMRVWLDARRVEPAVFRYAHGDHAAGIDVQVEFAVESEAAAFAAEFGGELVSP